MFQFLAQAVASPTTAGSQTPDTVLPQIWGRLDALAHPDKLVEVLSQLSMVWAGVFVAVGLVCLLQGYRIYKGAVLMLALALGGVVGYELGQQIKAEVIVAGCLGVLLAVVAWPLMKYAVAAAGGLAGAVLGANAWTGLADKINAATGHATLSLDAYWAGALIGLILFGLMAFILFEFAVVLFTSFSGATLAVMGAIALLLHVPQVKETVASSLQADPLIVPLLVIVPAVIGLVIQQQFGAMKKTSTKAS